MSCKKGAGDGDRTRDIQLGKLTLYQLSYSRGRLSIPGPAAGRKGLVRAPKNHQTPR